MEEKKTRKIVRADGSETKAAPVKKAAPQPAKPAEGSATGKRIGAFALWFAGIACEVFAIMVITGKICLAGKVTDGSIHDKRVMFIIAALVVDFIVVLIANQLWKRSNLIDPASEKNKVKFFLHNNLGVLMSLIAFVPIIIFLLKDKKTLNEQTKKFVAIGLIGFALICAVTGIDFNPISAEQKAQQLAEAEAAGLGEVYWTTFGHKYHYDQDCQHIRNSGTLYAGTVEEAIQANRTEVCKTCSARLEAGEIGSQAALPEATETTGSETVETAETEVTETVAPEVTEAPAA
ncbi:MAG: hypothetical protein Q4C53_01975 [Clostridia bacterium]|nr:hypothetical protein [Clostridia bacterium]